MRRLGAGWEAGGSLLGKSIDLRLWLLEWRQGDNLRDEVRAKGTEWSRGGIKATSLWNFAGQMEHQRAGWSLGNELRAPEAPKLCFQVQ